MYFGFSLWSVEGKDRKLEKQKKLDMIRGHEGSIDSKMADGDEWCLLGHKKEKQKEREEETYW